MGDSTVTTLALIERPSNSQILRLSDRPLKKVGQQRRYAPKTRTGCLTCKIRRVKCDEAHPFCNRCTSTGRKCDGYVSPGQAAPKDAEPLSMALVSDISCDALERRTFDFFRSRTAPCVSGYFQDSVWDRIVLQLSHSEPAVRHAVNALGALHEEISLRDRAELEGREAALIRTDFTTQQYTKALTEMQALLQDKNASLDTLLLCSLLCTHFESLRESFVPALMHCENAISLLQRHNSKFDARKVNPSVARAMMRVDLQGSIYLDMRTPGLSFYTAATDSVLPSTFHDLTQARDLINSWTCRLYYFMRTTADAYRLGEPGGVPLEELAQAQALEQTMSELDRLLWDYMHKPTVRLTLRETHGLNMLRSRVKMNRILAAGCLYAEATIYDQFLPEFEDIVTHCAAIMASDHADRRLFTVSLDEGLVHPLQFVGTHCRDSRTRHQALDLLRRLPARDGVFWHLDTIIGMVAAVIRFEEGPSDKESPRCEDIPEFWRIQSAFFDGWELEGPKKGVRVYYRTRPNGMHGTWAQHSEEMESLNRPHTLNDILRICSHGSEISSRIRSPSYIPLLGG